MDLEEDTLHSAVKTRDISLIYRILKRGVNPNQKDKNGRAPLHYAVMSEAEFIVPNTQGDEENTSTLASTLHQPLLYPGHTGDPSLVYSRRASHPDQVKGIPYNIKSYPRLPQITPQTYKNPQIQGSDGSFRYKATEAVEPSITKTRKRSDPQPFFRPVSHSEEDDRYTNSWSTERGSASDCVVELLNFGDVINVNIQDNDGRTPLHLAVRSGSLNCIYSLLHGSTNIDANIQDNDGRTPLHLAAHSGSRHCIYALLKNRTNLDANIQDSDGRTPLHLAAHSGSRNCIYALLESSTNLNANVKDNNGHTPLHLATQRDSAELVYTLLESSTNINVNIQDSDGRTPLHLATQRDSSELVSSLLENSRNIDSNIQDNNGHTPLHLAAQSGSFNCIHSLLEGDINLDANIQDKDGRTPLHMAILLSSPDTVYALLGNSTDIKVNIQDTGGRTPLHLATQLSSSECAYLLLDGSRIVEINIQDKQGHSPFHSVAFSDWEDFAPKILKRGADPSIIKGWGQFQRNPGMEKTISVYLKAWESSANGSDYGTIDVLVKDILAAGEHAPISSIVWEWEVPAVLNLSNPARETGDNTQPLTPGQHVLLTNNTPRTYYVEKSAKEVQATTCAEYLLQRWKPKLCDFVLEFLNLVKLAHLSLDNYGFSVCAVRASEARGGPLASVTCYQSSVLINFTSDALIEVVDLVEALDWLCKAMRMPRLEDSLSLSTTTCRLERYERYATAESIDSDPHGDLVSERYFLRPYVDLKISALPQSDHNCWHQLFHSCIVADSTLPQYRDFGKGLETSFDLMVSLAAVEFSLIINGGVIYIGYQTVLFPTAIQDGCAQFHLLTTTKSQINPYALDMRNRMLTDNASQFKGMRCFLGWCEAAQVNLGTKGLPATVKYSGGRNHGESLHLDGYSILAQVGTSSPLTALLGLQTNFRYTSHRPQFSPLGNYCKLLQDTSRELAIVYDASKRRSWLVPKLSLLLHMSHAYTLVCADVPDDRVPYVEPHADAIDIIKGLEPLGDTIVYGEGTDEFLFRQLMLGLNTNLLKTISSIRKSSDKRLYGFEFMDVVTEPGRGTCMKELELKSSGKNWLEILNAVDAVVVCSELGDTITTVQEMGKTSTKCSLLPENLDYLAATLPCLARLVQRKGGQLNTGSHHIKIAENALWELNGDPFRACQHNNTNKTCWERSERVQRLVSGTSIGFRLSGRTHPTSSRTRIPASGAVVFGKWKS